MYVSMCTCVYMYIYMHTFLCISSTAKKVKCWFSWVYERKKIKYKMTSNVEPKQLEEWNLLERC